MTDATRRGRLLRKYVVVLLVLVGGVLMASSLVELYFSYRETQRAIVRVERAKAVAAAARIEQFLKEIEQQVRETTRTASDDPDASQVRQGSLGFREGLGVAMAEQRELDFLRVLRNVPAVSELAHSTSPARSSSVSHVWSRMSSAARRTFHERPSSWRPGPARPTGVPSTSRTSPSRT